MSCRFYIRMSGSSVLSFSILRLQHLVILHPPAPASCHCSPPSGSSSVSSILSLFSILRLQHLVILHPPAPASCHCSPPSGSSSVSSILSLFSILRLQFRLQHLIIVLHPLAPAPVFCGPNLLSSLAKSCPVPSPVSCLFSILQLQCSMVLCQLA